ncbi:MAG: hypothetical protein JWR69_1034 [Pedosphaera sp.]|nr:hypothetical protein [Pedosphaera sp.]
MGIAAFELCDELRPEQDDQTKGQADYPKPSGEGGQKPEMPEFANPRVLWVIAKVKNRNSITNAMVRRVAVDVGFNRMLHAAGVTKAEGRCVGCIAASFALLRAQFCYRA